MNEYVNAAMVMIQKIIAAATPVAKQAYEIALLTLQIDAGGQLILAVVAIGVGALFLYINVRLWRYANSKECDNGAQPPIVIFGCAPCFFGGLALIFNGGLSLLSIWLWVKLIRPELWLAHMAIEKLVK